MNHLVENGGVFGLLDFVVGAIVTAREIGGKMLESRGVAKGEVATDATGVDRFLAIFDDAV